MRRERRFPLPLLISAGVIIAAAAVFAVVWSVLRGESAPDASHSPRGPFIVCLDAGHGGGQPGALNGERLEKDDNLKMALRVREILQERGVTCYMTRSEDTTMDWVPRVACAEEQNAAVFVSVHRNSGGGEGLEVWINNQPEPDEVKLAENILNRLLEASGMRDRGVKRGTASNPEENLHINTAETITCLLELGFIDSETDNDLFDTNFDAIAEAVAEGIMSCSAG